MKRLVYGYATRNTTATGSSANVRALSEAPATTSTARPKAASSTPSLRLSLPLGISRFSVRGLRASRVASMTRLAAIAAVRAPTMANVTSSATRQPGQPPAASSIAP